MGGYLNERDITPGGLGPEVGGCSVYNDSGGALAKGDLVAVTGWTTTATTPTTRIRKVQLADADASAPLNRATHVVVQAIPAGGYGRVHRAALIRNLDTSGVTTAGDPVYLHTTAGDFTATAPTGTAAAKQRVGYAVTKDASTGIVCFDLTEEREALPITGIPDNSILGLKLGSVTIPSAAGALSAANMGVEGVLILDVPDAASGNVDFTALPYKIQITSVEYHKTGGAGNAGNSSTLHNGTGGNAITNAMNSATDNAVVAPSTLDDAFQEVAANATLRVVTVKAGGSNAHRLVIRYVRVA